MIKIKCELNHDDLRLEFAQKGFNYGFCPACDEEFLICSYEMEEFIKTKIRELLREKGIK